MFPWTVASLSLMFTIIITPTTADRSCHGLKRTCEDILEARLSLLESRQTAFESKNYDLQQEADELKIRNNKLEAELNLLRNKILAVDSKCSSLKNRTELLETQVNVMEVNITLLSMDVKRLQDLLCQSVVSFYTRMSQARQTYTNPNSTIILDSVIVNHGDAYNVTSGVFTAPVNGTYFFLASTGDYWAAQVSVLNLMVDDVVVDVAMTSLPGMVQHVYVQGVLQLQAGQVVWLRNGDGGEYYLGRSTGFSGFLVHHTI